MKPTTKVLLALTAFACALFSAIPVASTVELRGHVERLSGTIVEPGLLFFPEDSQTIIMIGNPLTGIHERPSPFIEFFEGDRIVVSMTEGSNQIIVTSADGYHQHAKFEFYPRMQVNLKLREVALGQSFGPQTLVESSAPYLDLDATFAGKSFLTRNYFRIRKDHAISSGDVVSVSPQNKEAAVTIFADPNNNGVDTIMRAKSNGVNVSRWMGGGYRVSTSLFERVTHDPVAISLWVVFIGTLGFLMRIK